MLQVSFINFKQINSDLIFENQNFERNKKCHNLGMIKRDCTCDCMKLNGRSIFDTGSDCANIQSGVCVDDQICTMQYSVYKSNKVNCKFNFIRAMCPKLCGLCQ